MPSQIVRVELDGKISDTAADALGCRVENDRADVLVAPYIDGAQLTGLLVRLADLHLGFRSVVVATSHEGVTP